MTEKMPDPTPEEIEAGCKKLQQGWTNAQRNNRSAGKVTPRQSTMYKLGDFPSVIITSVELENKKDHIID